MWNSKFDPIERPYTAPELPQGWDDADVLRLTIILTSILQIISTLLDSLLMHMVVSLVRRGMERSRVGKKVLIGAGEAALVKLQT
jgi:hypothetical protein